MKETKVVDWKITYADGTKDWVWLPDSLSNAEAMAVVQCNNDTDKEIVAVDIIRDISDWQ